MRDELMGSDAARLDATADLFALPSVLVDQGKNSRVTREFPDGRGWFRTSDLSRVKQHGAGAVRVLWACR